MRKRILFYIVHPAQFYLFKNTINNLKVQNNDILIIIKDKDVLINLLEEENIDYVVLFGKRKSQSTLYLIWEMINRTVRSIAIAKKFRPDLIIGTPFDVAIIGKLLSIPSIIINEDDANVIPRTAKLGYPICDCILSPTCCDNGKWTNKTIKYVSYHELAYLHPDNFKPDFNIVKRYIKSNQKYVLIRLAKLNAHHDIGKSGINNKILNYLIKIIKGYNREIIISSERQIPQMLEKYRVSFRPSNMHHFMAFADLYIGDSQTMAAEASVLGTPSIRFNDFVGEIGYLNELEQKYRLTVGIQTNKPQKLLNEVEDILKNDNIQKKNINKLLNDKINFEKFLTWFIREFPKSVNILRKDKNYQYNFK